MIQANELRIGNWYKCRKTGLTEESYERFSDFQSFANYLYDCDPVPLTPEILRKCHFSERALAFTGHIGFTLNDEDYYIGLLDDNKGGWKFHNPHFNLTIQYLHQLQNLVFALTGKELYIISL